MPERSSHSQVLFEKWAPSYDDTIDREFGNTSGITCNEWFALLNESLDPPPHGKLLDLATGTGRIAIEVARRHPTLTVHAVDSSEAMLARAERNLAGSGVERQVKLAQGAGESLVFSDASFDLVHCSLALHHMQVPRVLAEVSRVLRPGGTFLLTDFVAPPTWVSLPGSLAVPVYRFFCRFSSDDRTRAENGYAVIWPKPRWLTVIPEYSLEIESFTCFPKSGRQWEPVPFLMRARKSMTAPCSARMPHAGVSS